MRQLYCNDTDHFSATSSEEAQKQFCKLYGFTEGELEEQGLSFEPDPVPGDKVLEVKLDEDVPEWVTSESKAEVVDDDVYNVVRAPAEVWARHVVGMVCTTEF